ncbi:unnamed protein product [Pedinophyceae sp. YPF-701]|nr:unnamed protein product [Pedinophyceae sp. YPF-701]
MSTMPRTRGFVCAARLAAPARVPCARTHSTAPARALWAVQLCRRTPLPSRRDRFTGGTARCAASKRDEPLGPSNVPEVAPMAFAVNSGIVYVAMTAGSEWLCRATGHGQGPLAALSLLPLDAMGPALLWTLPLLASLGLGIALEDKVEAIKKTNAMVKVTLGPVVRGLSPLTLLAVAATVGVGEEALFRGWGQSWMADALAAGPLPATGDLAGAAQPASVAIVGVIFGMLHAVTPLYLAWASAAGVLFGLEYQQHGLQAAMITHGLYDWLAFMVLRQVTQKELDDAQSA